MILTPERAQYNPTAALRCIPPTFYESVSEIIPCVPDCIIRDQQGLDNFPAVQKYNPSKVSYSIWASIVAQMGSLKEWLLQSRNAFHGSLSSQSVHVLTQCLVNY